MRLFRIIGLLLVAVMVLMVAPGMGEEQADAGSVGSPDSCSPTEGGPCIIADFIASPTTGDAPLRVQFLDTSSGNPSMWSWDFGDGGTSSAVADPVHIYTKPGKYTVRLVASSLTGGSSTKVKEEYIIVRDTTPIYADFVGSPVAGKAPLTVEFSDCTIGNPTTWVWDFGDGYTDSVQNPVHVYQKPGHYTVTLTASNELGGSSTKVKEKYIRVDPSCEIVADFSFTPESGFAPLTVKFTDRSVGSPTMWSWNFGDGSTDMVANPTHTFSQPGTYTVKMTASSQYCQSGAMEKVITISPCADIDADFAGVPTEGVAPLTVKFTDLSTGNPTMWSWDFGDGASDMVGSPTHVYTKPGVYTVKLTASNQYGKSDTAIRERYIVVSAPCSINADFVGTPTTGPGPLTVQFTDRSTGGPTMWKWDFGDGTIPMETCSGSGCDNIANPVHTYLDPGTYTVTLTASNQNGCIDTETKVNYIVVVPACTINADFVGTPTSGPGPLTVQFTDRSVGGPTMWKWDFGDGTIPMATCSGSGCDNIANPVHTYLDPGTYTVTLTASNQNGCTDTETKVNYIVVVPACSIDANFVGNPTTGPGPLTVQFTDQSTGGPTMWKWDFGDGAMPMATCSGSGCDNIANPVHTYLDPGTYTVTLTASNQNGCSDTEKKVNYITVGAPPVTDAIPISAGWNFVSVPKKLAPGCDTASIFSHIDVKGHSVFQYDASMHVWDMLNAASPIRPLDSFWIFSSKSDKIPLKYDTNPVQTPPTKTLKKGWNGVGFTGLTPLEAKYTYLSVQNQWVNSVGFNAPLQRYDEMIIKGSNDNTMLGPYNGYWLYMSADGILAANAA